MRRLLLLSIAVAIPGLAVVGAQERIDHDAFWKIRQEAARNSRILHTVHVLTDRYGPRLTGSPNAKAAGEWAVGQMQAWGLENAHLEPWNFNRPGWVNERLSAHLVSPVKDALVAEALGWTPSTNGVVRGRAMPIVLPERPTRAALKAFLDGIKDSVRGRIVLVGAPRQVLVSFTAPALRREDADVIAQMNATPGGGGGPRGGGPGPQQRRDDENRPLTNAEIEDQLNDFLVASGALVRINDAGRDHGQIRAFNTRTYDPARAITTVVMRNEDYGRIWRLMEGLPGAGPGDTLAEPVELEFEVVNRMYPEGRTSYNVIAEIRGSDKADEVVMLGAHLDSWHAGTGATDNAIGCAVMMEAARILVATGLRPRRTIRVALWTGEEQGLLGSQAYVREHFGTFEDPKPGYDKLAAYLNIDNGTGRARGLTVFGPSEAAAVLRDVVAPFRDLGVLGATTTRSRATGGSDHTSFNQAGLPGILVMQDPIQYTSHTWHTNLDTFERIVEEDAKNSAAVMAAVAYHLATRDELLPRFPRDEMPRNPRAQEGSR